MQEDYETLKSRLLMRINRLEEELELHAPDIVVKMELQLIEEACRSLRKWYKKNKKR